MEDLEDVFTSAKDCVRIEGRLALLLALELVDLSLLTTTKLLWLKSSHESRRIRISMVIM